MKRFLALPLPAVLVALLAAAPAAPQQGGPAPLNGAIDPETAPRPVAHATRTAEPITIDGRLDEPAWLLADSLTEFIQSQPNRGYPATDRTVVRILYDEDALYIAADCYDGSPAGLTITSLEQGFDSRESDVFGITLDTFLDRRNSFMFLINPAGAIRFGQTFDDSRTTDLAWRGVIHVRTRVHEQGWTAEIAIPWKTLRYNPRLADQEWGLNFIRRVRRKNEDSYWAPMDRRDPVHRMSKAGTLVGLGQLQPGRNLAIKPYLMTGTGSGSLVAPDARGGDIDGGFDLKYGVTPRLTFDLTYNTDFSQVEVDQQQVNLTRFSLFFPEKREFFVENSGVFTFGDVTEREFRMGASLRDFTLFHSRQIGLVRGQPVPIVGGARLTGRAAGFELGLLEMQTEGGHGSPAENFGVVRIRRSLAGSVDVGGMFLNRQATDGSGAFNRSGGIDLSARVGPNMIVNGYWAASDEPAPEAGERTAARLTAAWRDRLWDVSAMHKRVGEAFDPGLGFIRRTGIRHSYATLGAHPRPGLGMIYEINPYVEIDYITDPADRLETRTGTLGLGLDFPDGGTLTVSGSDRFEYLETAAAISGGATIPAGSYRFEEASLRYQSSLARPFSAGVTLGGGGYFHGDRRSVGVSSIWRPSYRASLELRADHNEITLPDRKFSADVYAARLRFATSTRLFGSTFIQYNQALDQLVSNVRVNLIHAPLSDLFLVLTERRGFGGQDKDGVLERFLTLKVTRLLDF